MALPNKMGSLKDKIAAQELDRQLAVEELEVVEEKSKKAKKVKK